MERTLDELKEEIMYWKAEVERVKERASDAYRRHYALEREIKRNKKPTPKQLETLRIMKDGAALDERGWSYPYHYYIGPERVAGVVFDGLRSREMISEGADGKRGKYFITAWGREVLAKAARKGAE